MVRTQKGRGTYQLVRNAIVAAGQAQRKVDVLEQRGAHGHAEDPRVLRPRREVLVEAQPSLRQHVVSAQAHRLPVTHAEF